MASVVSLIVIVTISILVTRIATIALVHTGLSEQVARFQARSAFTGVGYTTRESERIIAHPVRRQIIMMLMLLGNVGIISVLASLVLTFMNTRADNLEWLYRIVTLVAGLGILWYLSTSALVNKWLSQWINHLLKKYTNIQVRDFAGVLHLANGYEISEMLIDESNWMTNRKLNELQLRQEGLNVLGIEKEDGVYIGLPHGDTLVNAGDLLILYGKNDTLKKLNQRRRGMAGRKDHRKAVEEQRKREEEERKAEKKTEERKAGKEVVEG